MAAAVTFSASANFTAAGVSDVDVAATVTATGGRVQSAGSSVSATALFAATAREKWELIADPTDTWTPLADDSVNWTELPMRAA